MFKMLQSLLLSAALGAQLLVPGATPAPNLAPAKEPAVLKLDEKTAQEDAALHRLDGIGKLKAQAAGVQKPKTRPHPKNNTPNRLIATFNGDPETTRGFNWFTSDLAPAKLWVSESKDMKNARSFEAIAQPVVSHYVERDEKGFFLFQLVDKKTNQVLRYFTDEGKEPGVWDQSQEIEDRKTQSVSIDVEKVQEISYKATARGLKPGTTYYYQVRSDKGEKSSVGRFKTAKGAGAPFSFLHYTDTQNAFWNQHLMDEAAYGADTLARALKMHPDADFVVHTGDVVEIAEVEDEWVDLFEKSKASFQQTTLAMTAGNHDEYGINYADRFPHKYTDHVNVPAMGPDDGGTYYSYDYNGVHFVVLNTNDNKNNEGKALGKAQLEWLKKDVQAARKNGAQWVILNYHKPLFSKSYHSLQDKDVQKVRDEFMKLIDELDIDLALQGHDHVLSRTKSLAYVPQSVSPFNAKVADEYVMRGGRETLVNPEGTTFVLPNTGGTKAYDDIYRKGLDHVKKVRPALSWLTKDLLGEYENLFAFGEQPQKSPRFETSHANLRDSKVQNFAKYTVKNGTLLTELYQVEGDLKGERSVRLVDSFSIVKEPKPEVLQIQGTDRYETSVEVSKRFYPTADTVLLATGEVSADSLAAASLSALLKAPILLSKNDQMPTKVLAEIQRLGAKKLLVLGGERRIAQAALDQLPKNLVVERIAGETRYETAAKIAHRVLQENGSKTILVVNGSGAHDADALSAALLVHQEAAPILYAQGATLGRSTEAFLKAHALEKAVLLGGERALSLKTQQQLEALKLNTQRLGADNRYLTALAVAKAYAPLPKEVIVVAADALTDGTVASGILNHHPMPIILSDKHHTIPEVNEFLKAKTLERIYLLGGERTIQRIR
ncbi:hypothetical protein ABB02_00602 [Clostridiaceae bacterium JG1575]|nr:hypothetical protein ABB02_00602 [Clostridiaceae bacterium JG1575]